MFSLPLTVIAILIFHIWQVVGPVHPPAPASHLEYDGWRGKASLDVTDMVEIYHWMTKANGTFMDEAVKYYWVNNEVLYTYGAIVRGMFAAFTETTKDKKIAKSFLHGIEIIIHYILIRSYPVIGRRGGIRGTGHDRAILKAAVPPLIACYLKSAPGQNFTAVIFPIMRRRKKRRVFFRPVHFPKTKAPRGKRSGEDESETPVTDSDDQPAPPPLGVRDDAENVLVTDVTAPVQSGRYAYTLSHGSQTKAKMTNIVIADEDTNRLENVAVSIFWLVYELVPVLCQWTPAEITPYKEAFEKIVGLVVSMYLYDKADFGEQYERIFNMTTKQFETEWEKIEFLTKSIQKEKKLLFPKPYSEDL